MIRVKIRFKAKGVRKVLRFDKSIDFPTLLRKIIHKLGVACQDKNDPSDPRQSFGLEMGGWIIEDTSEIDHGDELDLVRIHDEEEGNATKELKVESSGDDIDHHGDSKPDTKSSQDNEASVPGLNESNSVKEESTDNIDVISISSDEDEDDYRSDDESWDGEYDGSDEEEDLDDRPSKRQKHVQSPPSEPPLEVFVHKKDIPSAPGKCDEKSQNHSSNDDDGERFREVSLLVDGAGKKKAEQEVKNRIMKLLNTGFHDQSNEHEAKNAMKLAQRLMRKHNLSQALLLKEREAANEKNLQGDEVLKGGMVRVKIVNRKTRKPSLFFRWIARLTRPVCENFGVQCYFETRRGVRCDIVFYGIYSNAQLAGYAFKVATERISQMSAEYQPETLTYYHRTISTKSSRLSYALGIVEGISKDVEKNVRMEKMQRERKLERARLAESKGEAYEESEDEDDCNDNGTGGLSLAKPENESKSDSPQTISPNNVTSTKTNDNRKISGANLQSRVEELEQEAQAAIVLVCHKKKIAEEVLKEHDIKLKSAPKRKAIDFDKQSYYQGIEDSKEIDMNQRAIRAEVKIKTEKNDFSFADKI